MRFVKQASVVVGLISAVVGLVFLFFPQIRPDSPGPKPQQSARISGVELVPHATKGQFLDYSDQEKTGLTKQQLDVVGASAAFKLTLEGYKDQELLLQRQLVNARTGDVIGKAQDITFTPTDDATNGRPWWDWVPLRSGRGSYVLVFKLFAEPNEPAVECKQTKPFAGLEGAVPAKIESLCPS